VRNYEPIWTGLDPENRYDQLRDVLLGAVFAGKSEHWSEGGVRPLLVFEKEGWGTLGIAPAEPPQIGHAGQPWYADSEDRGRLAWEEASGRTVSWVGPGVLAKLEPDGVVALPPAPPATDDHELRTALLVLMDEIGIALPRRGKGYYLKGEPETAESEDA
jgi:hypothetical protein